MSILLDVFLVVLLSMAIGYGVILNRRIMALRNDQKSLDKLATKFAEATIRAEQSIIKLKSTTDGASQSLDKAVNTAGLVRDDLEFLIDRGNKLADILETDIRRTERQQISPGASFGHNCDGGAEAPKVNEDKSQAERELLRALQAVR
ncbi:MAG: hypothetical protein CBD27_00440 [Rhodospirillaceae bacterium TMED167]|nr:hypothetical protein [Rhodospirillaceae bacterium]OUW31087.1 MAG: hypothetical protein CBD27_00440 [Rhodospirillaceae bacterium TMED167]